MKFKEFTPEQQAEWEKWKNGRPKVMLDLAERFPPNILFRLKTTGQRVYPVSYNEDGTLKVCVSAQFNAIATFERNVFGINPDDLEECDLPGQDDRIGMFTNEDGPDALRYAVGYCNADDDESQQMKKFCDAIPEGTDLGPPPPGYGMVMRNGKGIAHVKSRPIVCWYPISTNPHSGEQNESA